MRAQTNCSGTGTPSGRRGFTLLEMMVVVAIVAITSAMAVPAWNNIQDNARLNAAARNVANAFDYARSQSIVSESTHIVFFQQGAGTDNCGNAIGAPMVVLNDLDNDCCIDGGENNALYFTDPREILRVNWGSAFAPAQVAQDAGTGPFATGSSFTDQAGVARTGVAFRADGVPVGFTNACVLGQVGTGAGGIYITGTDAGGRPSKDVAVVLSPLGTSKIFSFDRSTLTWTQ